jgi:hypothetical protein
MILERRKKSGDDSMKAGGCVFRFLQYSNWKQNEPLVGQMPKQAVCVAQRQAL